MQPTSRTERPRDLLAKLAVVLTILGTAWACAVMGRSEVDVQDWWSERGPVVPHDSFPGDCTLCHTGDDWQTIREDFVFDHEAETGVALLGAHAGAECLRCHNDRGPAGVFAARGCQGCHQDQHRRQLGENCEDCHGQEDWRPHEQIALHSRMGFALIGAHAATACWRCHVGADEGVFSATGTDCAGCHMDDLAQATNPDHQAQGWVQDCDRCHIPTSWSGGGFNHSTFLLEDSHLTTDCLECHVGNVFEGTPRECVGCHLGAYQASTDPDHVAAGFPTSCETCHDATTWNAATFGHGFWPLTGQHRLSTCNDCHAGGVFAGTPSQCYDCHADEYANTTDPDHVTSGFPMSCEDCHNTTTWERANFTHDSWPLTGSHQATDCILCHSGGVYAGTPNQCEDCHLPQYQRSTDPHHQAAGFSTQCDSCHDTTIWESANYSHSFWRLTGAHQGASCSACHQSRVYSGLRNDCVDCHLQEYQTADDPDHVAAGFPQSCDTCHTTFTWQGAQFDHSFPIDNGDHKRLDCTDCHLRPRNFSTFSCTHCHDHNQPSMAEEHKRVGGYVWETSACYNCHMDGKR